MTDVAEATLRRVVDKATELRAEAPETLNGTREAEGTSPEAFGLIPIDWAKFWADETPSEEWLIKPVVAAGRSTALYASAKLGKSLLALDCCAALAAGRSVLGQPAQDPVAVIYVDMEMTAADLRERLVDLGYGPDDDLGLLAYYQLPALPPLDTELGGDLLTAMAVRHGALIVVVDTMARAVRGEENLADTYRNFYRYTGARLKAAGIALWRLDHAGKDPSAGQRGSSGKADDVDVVFKLEARDAHSMVLKRTHTRIPWVPVQVVVVREDEPFLRHTTSIEEDTWPAGTVDAANALDGHDVPLDATTETAMRTLRKADQGRRRAVVQAALRFRRNRP